jgi:hypothetical protein
LRLPFIMVKFDRQAVINLIMSSQHSARHHEFARITLTITGTLMNGTSFEGSVQIRILLNQHRNRNKA